MRRSAAAASVLGVLLLMLGAAVAYAGPGFVLTQSEAGAGEAVHFTISGTDEDGATFELEIGDKEVAEGSIRTDGGVSGAFTMPDLGETSTTVTVEAHVSQPDETTTLSRTLQYRAPSQEVAGPAGTDPGPVTPPAHSVQRGSAPGTRAPTPARKQRPARRPVKKRPGPASRPSTRERRSRGPQLSSHSGSNRRLDSSPSIQVSARYASPRSSGDGNNPGAGGSKEHSSSERGAGLGALTVPATSSLTPAISGDDGSGISLAVLVGLVLGSLAALALVSEMLARRWLPAPVQGLQTEDADDEILRGVVHVPDSASSSHSNRR